MSGSASTVLDFYWELLTWKPDADPANWWTQPARQAFLVSNVLTLLALEGKVGGAPLMGNGVISVEIDGPIIIDDRVKVSMTYCKETVALTMVSNHCKFVIPMYEGASADFAFTVRDSTVKLSLKLSSKRSGADHTKLKADPSLRNPVGVKVTYELVNDALPQRPGSPDIMKAGFDTLKCALFEVCHAWLGRPGPAPPLGPYMLATDIALKFGVSAMAFYTLFVGIMMTGFCEDGRFLEGFVAVILALVAVLKWWPAKPVEAVEAVARPKPPEAKPAELPPDKSRRLTFAKGRQSAADKARQSADDADERMKMEEARAREALVNAAKALKKRVPGLLKAKLADAETIDQQGVLSLMMLLSVFANPDECEAHLTESLRAALRDICLAAVRTLVFEFRARRAPLATQTLFAMACPGESAPVALVAQRQHASVRSLVLAATELMARVGAATGFFRQGGAPLASDFPGAVVGEVERVYGLLAQAFVDIDPLPTKEEIQGFVGIYRGLWEFCGKPPERSAGLVFGGMVARWLRVFADDLVACATHALAVDNFAVPAMPLKPAKAAKGKMPAFPTVGTMATMAAVAAMHSTSVSELAKLIEEKVDFLNGLKAAFETVEVHVMSYLSLCGSTVRGYLEALVRLASGFTLGNRSPKMLEGAQRFVALNDIISVRTLWNAFLGKVCKRYDLQEGLFADLLGDVDAAIGGVLHQWTFELAIQTMNVVREALFADGQVKAGASIKGVTDAVMRELAQQIGWVGEAMVPAWRPRAVVQFVRAVVLGFFEGMAPFGGIQQPQLFFAAAQALGGLLTLAIDLVQKNVVTVDFEKVNQQIMAMDEFQWMSWVISAQNMDVEKVREFRRLSNEVPQKVAIADMVIRQKTVGGGSEPAPMMASFLPL